MELVEKLEGWGWDCGQSVDVTTDDEAVDETATDETEEMLGETE